MSDEFDEYDSDDDSWWDDWQEGDPIELHPDFDDNYVVIPPEKTLLGDMSGINTPEQALERLRELGITDGAIEIVPHGGWSVSFTAPNGGQDRPIGLKTSGDGG